MYVKLLDNLLWAKLLGVPNNSSWSTENREIFQVTLGNKAKAVHTHLQLLSSTVTYVVNLHYSYRETYKQVLEEDCQDDHKYNPHQVGGSHICNFIFIITQMKQPIKVQVCCHGFDKSTCRGSKSSALEENINQASIRLCLFQKNSLTGIPFVKGF